MAYDPITPPFPPSGLPERSPEEAESYFAWFKSEIPKRLDQLRTHFGNAGGGDRALLDFSPDSLKPLWQWYLEHALVWLPKPREQFEAEYNRATGFVRQRMLKDRIYQVILSPDSRAVATDIGIYLGEVFVRNHEGVEWVINRQKNYTDTHHPVLSGFGNGSFFNPIEQALALVHETLDESKKHPDRLYAHYERYCHYLKR